MKLRTFSAPTMADALFRVKAEMGQDALILHTRTVRRKKWMGLRRQQVVEITAGSGLGGGSRPIPRRKGPRESDTPMLPFDHTPAGPAPRAADPPGRALLQSPQAANAVMLSVSQEMGTLKTMVSDLLNHSRGKDAPQVPPELLEYYARMLENQVARELAEEVLKNLRDELRPEQLKNDALVHQRLLEQLEKLLPVAGPIVRTKTVGPHVVVLIGPTGVGKTTTLAKLAANLKLRENRSVGLITIDTYRIAAVEQLRKYADILGSPLRVVMTPPELREAIASMNDCEFVLIDTAGRSPSDTLKLNELRNFIAAASPDEVHLVVSTTHSQQCIEEAIRRFEHVRVDKIIFTKFDEAVHLGVVLNVVRKVKKGLSYVTTGQNVPDDIEVGRSAPLARRIMGDQP